MSPKVQLARHAILQLGAKKPVAGQKIPSERELARQLGMNHRTVRRALETLVNEGSIEKRPRVGNFFREVDRLVSLAVLIPEYFLNQSGQHQIIGLFLEGIHEVIDARTHQVSTLSYRPAHFMEDAGKLVLERQIKGVLLIGNYQIPPEAVQQLMAAGVEIVLLTRHRALTRLGLAAVFRDFASTLAGLIDGLVERGYRRITIVRYTHPASQQVTSVVEEACARYRLGAPEEVTLGIPNGDGHVDHSPLLRFLDSTPRPEAIIVPDEAIAGLVFRECYRHRLRVPDDIAVAACSDLTPTAHPVPLTAPDSVALERKRSVMAATQLLEQIAGKAMPGCELVINGGPIWRESVGRRIPQREEALA